ncbi:hypothetical protein ACT7DO_16500 [Bacillus pacificus]
MAYFTFRKGKSKYN